MSVKVFKSALLGTLGFFMGFILGTIVDVIFYKFYYLIDPNEKNDIFLSIMFIVQFFTLLIILQLISQNSKQNKIFNYSVRMGLFASQIFLLDYTMNRLFGSLHPSRTSNKKRLLYSSISGEGDS